MGRREGIQRTILSCQHDALEMEEWFVATCITTTVVVVFALTLLGREARQKNRALKCELQEMARAAENITLLYEEASEKTHVLKRQLQRKLKLQAAAHTLQLQHTLSQAFSLLQEHNVPTASLERMLQASAAGHGAGVQQETAVRQMQPVSLLLRLLDAEDLAGMLLRFVPPIAAARCGLTCHAACHVFSRRDLVHSSAPSSQDTSATERFDALLSEQRLEQLRPGERNFPDGGSTDSHLQSLYVHVDTQTEAGGVWTLERKLLHEQTPVFNVISFVQYNGREWDEHSDALTHMAETQIEHAAEWLARHPGVKLRVDGYALQDAALGGAALAQALAQARAARVRKRLLERLQAIFPHPHWVAESAEDDGVRLGGYSEEGDELDAVIAFYAPRVLGRTVQAVGRWPHACADWSTGTRKMVVHHDNGELPCSVVEISVVGFEPVSVLAF